MRSISAAAVVLLVAVPLSAQGFSGTIEARFLSETTPPLYVNWLVSGDRWQMQLTDEAEQLAVIRVLFNRQTREQWEGSFIGGRRPAGAPMPQLDTVPQRPTPALQPGAGKQVIAGQECQDYTFEADGHALSGCFAASLGRFIAPRLRAPVALPSAPGAPAVFIGLPAWALVMSESELFPLKVWDNGGQVLMEVKRVTPGPAPECFYDLPPAIPSNADPAASAMTSMTVGRTPDGQSQVTTTLRDGRLVVMVAPVPPPAARGAPRPLPPPSCKPPAGRGRRP